jgi:hypothetical protein
MVDPDRKIPSIDFSKVISSLLNPGDRTQSRLKIRRPVKKSLNLIANSKYFLALDKRLLVD